MARLPLRALIVEDSAEDTELLLRELRRGNYDPTYARVETAETMTAALSEQAWDIVFSDFTMPQFNAFDALAQLHTSEQDIPFIIVSGTIGEDRAVTAMKAGAHDYILKGNLKRLVPAVERELREARMRAERKQAEQALRDAEARYRLLFEQSPDGVLLIDPKTGRAIEANERAYTQLGYTREEFADLQIADYEALESPDESAQRTQAILRLGYDNFDTLHRTKSGEIKNVHVWAKTLQLGGRDLFYAIFQDVTDRSRAHAVLNLQSAALNAASDTMIITDSHCLIEWVNPSFTALTGYSAEEAIGKNPRELVKSGVHDEVFYKEISDTILAGDVWHGEVTNRRKDGSLYIEEQTITPVKDARGEIAHFVEITRDLTEKKHLEAQFLQSQKMESVGRLAATIAHDFNNLLNVINGTAVLASEGLKEGDPLQGDLEEIRRAGERAALLTRQILAFSRQQIMKPDVFELNTLVADLSGMLPRMIGEDIELVVVPAKGSCSIRADPGQMEQVLMNLVVNARDAMPTHGTLTIETRAIELDGTHSASHPSVTPGPYVRLTVSDSGVGMDEATRTRIFEPFFTTKEVGKGTGLGLSTVYGIVQQSGGSIAMHSELGRGTTFEIYLPRVDEMAQTERPTRTLTPLSGTETILVVEDYLALRELAKRILQSAGYTVLEASNGEEALQLLEGHDGPVHLLLTDVVLPGMGGRELAARVADARPEIKVVYASGYTDDALVRHGVVADATHFLVKPYTSEALTRTVRAVLDAPVVRH